MATYQREEELRRRVNRFLEQAFDLPAADYYARLDLQALLGLKSALSDINNTLTLRLTLGFLKWAAQTLSLAEEDVELLRAQILASKPSSNGYDVQFHAPPFIAEVKCNVPINGGAVYGSAQQSGVLADVRVLMEGKFKAQDAPENALKFMVFMDLPNVRLANEKLIKNNPRLQGRLVPLPTDAPPSDPNVVYAVYAQLGA
jgi:hypothetical protein